MVVVWRGRAFRARILREIYSRFEPATEGKKEGRKNALLMSNIILTDQGRHATRCPELLFGTFFAEEG